jgi:hypothetical protein
MHAAPIPVRWAGKNIYSIQVMDWEEIERAHFAQQHCSI